MRAADSPRPASRPASRYAVRAVATLLAGQLAVATGAVAARAPGAANVAPATRGAAPDAERGAAPDPAAAGAVVPARSRASVPLAAARTAPVRVAAAGLWPGVVTAEPVAVSNDGTLGVPRTAGSIGWWAAGTRPGDVGAAVLVGHVDLDGRPGVFRRLAAAAPGTVVTVDAGAGPVAFRVTEVRQYPKDAFPADAVYAPTAARELRLITCGGAFDRRTGHYADNVVVSARAV